MASIEVLGKAKLLQQGMTSFFNVKPDLDIQSDYVRIFYAPDKLIKAQKNFETKMEQEPGELRPEIKQIITPYIMKKATLPAVGLVALGYILGKTM